jgi:CheY-like chemotaxis protein
MSAEPNGRQIILVVEDDAGIRESLADVLEEHGYQVIAAESGRRGLELLEQSRRPSLILLDLMMPEMSGTEFLSELQHKAELARIPVVVVSAWPKEAEGVRHRTHGFVKKPVSLKTLLRMVDGLCSAEVS